MTDHDYNPPDHPLHFANDRKQTQYSVVIVAIAALLFVLLLLLLIR